jgi:DNA-binding NtrC family response regulator
MMAAALNDIAGASVDPVWTLRLIHGPMTWSTWPITERPLLVGRSMGCHVCIEDPAVSRVQCELALKDGGPYLWPRSQSVPTLLNGNAMSDAVAVRLGDTIEFSGYRLIIDVHSGSPLPRGAESETPPTTQRFDESIFLGANSGAADATSGFTSDLLSLLTLQRMLAKSATVDEMAETLDAHFKARLEGSRTWIAWSPGDVNALTLVTPVAKEEQGNAPFALLREAATLGEGVYAGNPVESRQATLAAPLRHAGATFGAIAVQRDLTLGSFTKLQLHYLLAVADGLAPLLLATEKMAQLGRDARSMDASAQRASIVGTSPPILEALENLKRAAHGNGNVMLFGETGTGKELAARMLHDLGTRAQGPFVSVNCAAIPEELFESECFGHERGAFSGASQRRRGLFEQAHGGTLFLDEVGELSAANQSRLLRAVEAKAFRRVGGEKEIVIDLRIVCATNRALQTAGESGFRPDLFYRLATFVVWLPPLRERTEDIEDIAKHFLAIYSPYSPARPTQVSEGAVALLREYRWPGNVRELRNVIEQACYRAQGISILPEDLVLPRAAAPPTPATSSANQSLDDVERSHLIEVLRVNGSNVSRAADALGIAASTLYYKLRRHGISLRNPG